MAHLPIEIVLRIVESLAPENALALSPPNPRARTIRTFLFVSRTTYVPAMKLLYKHCLFIDSADRLLKVLNALATHLKPDRLAISTLPNVNIITSLQHLYLAPYRTSIDDLPMAQWIFELAAVMRDTAKRVYLNIPFPSLPPASDHLSVLPKLQQACDQFAMVQEAVLVGLHPETLNETFPNPSVPLWHKWQSLRKLAMVDTVLWEQDESVLQSLAHLTFVVIIWVDKSLPLANLWRMPRWSLQRDFSMVHIFYNGSYSWLSSCSRYMESLKANRTFNTAGHLKVELRRVTQHTRDRYPSAEAWILRHGVSGQLFDLEYLDRYGGFDSPRSITV